MKSKLLKLKSFLGRRVIKLVLACSLVGIFYFLVEISFVYVLQLFLLSLGLIDNSQTFLPSWLPRTAIFSFIVLVIFGLMKAFGQGLKIYFTNKTQQAFLLSQRSHLLKISFLYASKSTKEITAAFSELSTQAGSVVNQTSQLIVSLVSASLFLIYGTYLAPKEMVIGIVTLFVIALPLKTISQRINKYGKKIVIDFTNANERLLTGLKNSFFIRLYGFGESEVQKGKRSLIEYEKSMMRYAFGSSVLSAFPIASGVTIIAILTLVSRSYFDTSGIKLMAFFYVFIRFAQSMSETFNITSYMRVNFESFKKLYEWSIKKDIKIPENYRDNEKELISIRGSNLAFSYDNESVFNEVNFDLKLGDIFLIKGESGSGKSTLLNLILGLYKGTTGDVFYNDKAGVPKNIADFIGYVGPTPYIITGTIRENLFYGLDKERSEDEILSAIKFSSLDSMNLGLDSYLSDNTELSTGQKQRLSIARAILRSPKLLILDEATSNLDSVTENKIIDNLMSIHKDIITIVVSHRDSFDHVATKRLDM